MNRLAAYINRHIDGVVYSSPKILSAYATDRSPLSYYPRLVVEPIHSLDVRKILRFSYQLAQKQVPLPISVRGSGLSKVGSDLGTGIILSTARLNHIQEIDIRQRLIRVQVGVTLRELQSALSLHGFYFAVKGDEAETIGDLIARGAVGYVGNKTASIADLIQCAEVVLADGSIANFEAISRIQLSNKVHLDSLEGDIYHQLQEVAQEHQHEIRHCDGADRAGLSGIRDALSGSGMNLIPLLCGSENSLGVVTEVILRIAPTNDTATRIALVCHNASECARACKALQRAKLTDCMLYDTEIFNELAATGKSSKFFKRGFDDGYLIVATIKDESQLARYRKRCILRTMLRGKIRYISEDADNARDFDSLSATLSAYLNDTTSVVTHMPIADGVYIPEENLAKYLNQIMKISDELKLKLAVFGAPEFGIYNLRPNLSVATNDDRKKMMIFMRKYTELVYACDGYLCGDCADGRWSAIFVDNQRHAERVQLELRIKQAFDPHNILTPDIKTSADSRTVLRHFRTEFNTGISSVN